MILWSHAISQKKDLFKVFYFKQFHLKLIKMLAQKSFLSTVSTFVGSTLVGMLAQKLFLSTVSTFVGSTKVAASLRLRGCDCDVFI